MNRGTRVVAVISTMNLEFGCLASAAGLVIRRKFCIYSSTQDRTWTTMQVPSNLLK